MLSLYVNFTKISEVSMYTPVDGFLEHPLIGKHGVTFTLDGGFIHRKFNMIELFMALRQPALGFTCHMALIWMTWRL